MSRFAFLFAIAFFVLLPVVYAEESTLRELELQREILNLQQTITGMQIEYANLLSELARREALKLKPAIDELQEKIEKKRKEK